MVSLYLCVYCIMFLVHVQLDKAINSMYTSGNRATVQHFSLFLYSKLFVLPLRGMRGEGGVAMLISAAR